MCDFQLIPCLQNATREQMHKIRQTVHFTDREYNRDHPDDKTANHHCFLFTFKDKAVGTVRLDFLNDQMAAVRLGAILPEYQRQKMGTNMPEALETNAKQHSVRKLVTNARTDAESFYKSIGYTNEAWMDPGEGTTIAPIPLVKI